MLIWLDHLGFCLQSHLRLANFTIEPRPCLSFCCQISETSEARSRKKMAYRYSKLNACCLLSCRDNSTLNFAFADPLPCIMVKVIEMSWSHA